MLNANRLVRCSQAARDDEDMAHMLTDHLNSFGVIVDVMLCSCTYAKEANYSYDVRWLNGCVEVDLNQGWLENV